MKAHAEVHALGCFVYGILVAFHALGILYNVRRRNHFDTAIHTAVLIYDAKAVHHHYQEARNDGQNRAQ